ncbi:NADH-quinone oxidoreductase subunit J [Hydrogenivirga sp. 128-5-R1-1]|uniref:NADH-quinone oxidoreductase subunit J family protein n=1 Tax=Hydrogenivirga sp. 128-5-R1-1 TaxID=392423 RepID=UPI00015F138B|nr:NADH-quinone oxidoreductase subunit J [Hydrogenivirga sp. 128-5-R1-1]EDP73750.1 NADH dehydrogenase I chain J [Hydrogenivirga sp. 128-5-R1-1]
MELTQIAFWIFSSLAVLSAIGTIFFRNMVYTVLSLISTLIMVSGLFFTMGAELVGAIQLLIYAVAIVVFYVLVISTVPEFKGKAVDPKYMLLSIPVGFLIFLELAYVSIYGAWKSNTGIFSTEVIDKIGNAKAVGTMLFTKYLFPFEVASLILLVAMIGAIIIGRKEEKQEAQG